MKTIAHILIIVILTLNIIPCNDVVCDNLGDKSSLENTLSDSHSNSHENDDADHCSPFCSCSCSQTAKVFSEQIVFAEAEKQNIIIPTDIYEFLKDSFPSELYRPPIV